MSLPGVEPVAPVWRAVRRHLDAETDKLRAALETAPEHITVIRLQARIAAYRALIAKVEDPQI